MVLALGLSQLFHGDPWTAYIDPALSMFIGVSLVLAATKTLPSSAVTLVDRSLEERSQLLILRALTEHFDDFEALHGIRTYRRRHGYHAFTQASGLSRLSGPPHDALQARCLVVV